MTRFLSLALCLALAACGPTDAASPTLEPVDPGLAFVYNPLHPGAPFCPAGTTGASIVRIHSYWTHVPTSSTIAAGQSDGQRMFQTETYGYNLGSQLFCRNTTQTMNWRIENGPGSLVTEIQATQGTTQVIVRHKAGTPNGGPDWLIAEQGPKQIPAAPPGIPQAVAGSVADTVLLFTSGF